MLAVRNSNVPPSCLESHCFPHKSPPCVDEALQKFHLSLLVNRARLFDSIQCNLEQPIPATGSWHFRGQLFVCSNLLHNNINISKNLSKIFAFQVVTSADQPRMQYGRLLECSACVNAKSEGSTIHKCAPRQRNQLVEGGLRHVRR